jgi:eukaryotic-like serine/threonine-protein kinase
LPVKRARGDAAPPIETRLALPVSAKRKRVALNEVQAVVRAIDARLALSVARLPAILPPLMGTRESESGVVPPSGSSGGLVTEGESPRSASRISVGKILGGKFEIVGVLGEGGTGIVYDAVRIAEKDAIALKVIHQHLLGDKQIRARFAREATILSRLHGPNLLAVLDSGEIPDPRGLASGILYLALPKVDGPALDQLLARDGPLPIDRALDIVFEVCVALNSAHSQGVIHRDLKPANVILDGDKRVIVVDFGMAKIVTGGGTGTTALTVHNMVFGTPEYMAPEQARGDELDARCDVYATGVMLYELLTGSVPFSGTSPLNVLTAHMTAPPPPPRLKNPDRRISPALEAVVLHAIAKDPADRYATAAELGAAIMQARSQPEDMRSVRPGFYRVEVDASGEDGARATVPALASRSLLRPVPSASLFVLPPRVSPLPSLGKLPVLEGRRRTFVWIVAAIVSISVGAWLSLRLN